jgi:drug/metabolite transporter (DMT)-like permease
VSRACRPLLLLLSALWGASAFYAAAGIFGQTRVASIPILFRMLRLFGAARLSLVTYLLPVTALIYGALILHERLNVGVLGGLALILAGVALGSGAVRLPRRAPLTQSV